MAKTITKLGFILAPLLLILACAVPTVTPPPPGFVDTAIAGTYSVASSQTAQAKSQQGSPESVTVTESKIASATALATFTRVVLGASQVKALVDVACPFGPGSLYERMFLLRRGQIADVVGRSADGGYWILRNPDRPDRFCWVESFTVQLLRLTGILPVMTPPLSRAKSKPPVVTPIVTGIGVPTTLQSHPMHFTSFQSSFW